MTLLDFVEQVIESGLAETFVSDDEEVEITHSRAEYSGDREGLANFEYHTADEQSGLYVMDDMDYVILEEMAQDLFSLPSNQVNGYIQ